MVVKKTISNLQLAKLKSSAMKLRANYQLPYILWVMIRELSIDSSVAYINSLKSDTEHYLRIKGYYKKYPSLEKVINDELSVKYNWTRKD